MTSWTELVNAPPLTQQNVEFIELLLQNVIAEARARNIVISEVDDKWMKDQGTRSRYARARQWDMTKATEMMTNSLEWRVKMKPDSILVKDMEVEAQTGKIWISGKDLLGRPIVILDNASSNTTDIDNQMRFLAFNLQRAVRRMEGQVEKVVVFINLSRWTLMGTPPLRATRETIDILSNQFPERLGVAILWDSPWIFEQFFSAIKIFIDPVTASKVAFLRGSFAEGSEVATKLKSVMGDNWQQLTGIGGVQETPLSSPGYVHSVIWPQVEQEEKDYLAKASGSNSNNNN